MKTTVNIANDLLLQAKELAKKEKTTLRQLVEEGLRDVLSRAGRQEKTPPVDTVVFKGKGLQPEFRDASWDAIRDTIYGRQASK